VIPDKTLGPIRNSAGGGHWDWVLQKWESKGHTVLSLSQLCLWLYWCLWLHSWDGWESLLKLGTSNVIWTRSFSHGNYILGSRAKNTSSLMSWDCIHCMMSLKAPSGDIRGDTNVEQKKRIWLKWRRLEHKWKKSLIVQRHEAWGCSVRTPISVSIMTANNRTLSNAAEHDKSGHTYTDRTKNIQVK